MRTSRPLRSGFTAVAPLVCAAFLASVVSLSAVPAQEKAKPRLPKKGDEVIVKGCLDGLVLTATETSLASEEDPPLLTPMTYQLKGDKDLLKQLRSENEGRLVEVTGLLKSVLPLDDAHRGLKVGKTRIIVGSGSTTGDRMAPGNYQSLPVLEVKSFMGIKVICGS